MLRTGLFVAGRLLATALLCLALVWSVSGAFAQGAGSEETLGKPVYERVIDWVQEKIIAIVDWIKDGFSRLAALLFGWNQGQLAAQDVPAASPRVAGESALSEELPLTESFLSETIPEPEPAEPAVEPVTEEVVAQEPEVEQENTAEQAPESVPVVEPVASEETTEPSQAAQPVVETEEEEKKSSDVIVIHAPDSTPPQSSVTALAATTTSADFTVAWEGQDNRRGSITLRFDVQYQVDSGDWTSWLAETVLLSSLFTGSDEKTYKFRSRAKDPEGNWEEYPEEADTSTYLNLSVPSNPAETSHTNGETLGSGDDADTGVDGVQITLAGTGDANDTLVITLSETSTTATTTIGVGGSWSQQFTLSEGANSFSLRSSEADGDSSNTVSFSLTLELVPTYDVVINEIAWMGTAATGNDEWMELYNASSTEINLAGWTLKADDGTPSITLSGTIAAKSYFVLERTASTTISDVSENVIYTGALTDGNYDRLSLRNSFDSLIDRVGSTTVALVAFGGNASTKATMERLDPTASGTDPDNWATNDETLANGQDALGNSIKGTPGGLNSVNTTIPRTITGLTFQYIYTSDSSVRLYWTAPKTANLATTTAATYDVRYSSAGAITSANWASASQAAGEPTPSATPSTVQTFNVTGLTASTTYHFAVRTNNGVEDSGVSNSPDTRTWQAGGASYTTLAFAGDNVPGPTYTLASSTGPYFVDRNFTVPSGVTLIVEPGAVIKMNTDLGSTGCNVSALTCSITVNGTLKLGSASDSINGAVITSRDDDTYGGATATSDGSASAGDWGRIITGSGGSLDFDHAIVRYGAFTPASFMITVSSGSSANINSSIIEYGLSHGIVVGGSTASLTIVDSIIRNHGDVGVGVTSQATASIQGSTFTGNTRGVSVAAESTEGSVTITGNNFYTNNGTSGSTKAGLQYGDNETLTATDNWWGDANGPTTADPDFDNTHDAAIADGGGTITYTPYTTTQFSVLPSNL